MSRMMQHSCGPYILLAKPSLQWQLELQLEKERLTLMKRSQIYLQRKLKTERFR